jgi:hypothetical protein
MSSLSYYTEKSDAKVLHCDPLVDGTEILVPTGRSRVPHQNPRSIEICVHVFIKNHLIISRFIIMMSFRYRDTGWMDENLN